MDPQTIDLDHGRLLFNPLKKHATRLLNSLQRRVRFQAQALPKAFWNNDPACLINPDLHTIKYTIYHNLWHNRTSFVEITDWLKLRSQPDS